MSGPTLEALYAEAENSEGAGVEFNETMTLAFPALLARLRAAEAMAEAWRGLVPEAKQGASWGLAIHEARARHQTARSALPDRKGE